MVHITIDFPESVLGTLREDPEGFRQELRLAAAVKWYEMKNISQERAAEIAGLSRSAFLEALRRFQVSPFQVNEEDIAKELCL
ncbi:UPF0175 family protein [Myxococcota bacterium]|nr:UPF0175 family protein [Myxococcota bacterium]